MAKRKTIYRRTMVELKQAICDVNGWKRKAGESMSARIKPFYDVKVDHATEQFIAEPK